MELGKDIDTHALIDQLGFFNHWEDKYRYIIDLGKSLPALPQTAYTESHLVKGCQSQVWLSHTKQDGCFVFAADSDAIIVKGLLAIVLIAYNYKTAQEIAAFDIENYFAQLDLLKHISNIRGNGLKAMVGRIQSIAATN